MKGLITTIILTAVIIIAACGFMHYEHKKEEEKTRQYCVNMIENFKSDHDDVGCITWLDKDEKTQDYHVILWHDYAHDKDGKNVEEYYVRYYMGLGPRALKVR